MTTHTTTTGDRPETPWPIDPFTAAGGGYRQRVLIEAEVFDDPDPEEDSPEDRYYTFAIANGDPNVQGRELLSIREDHVRAAVRRMPETAPEPTMVPAYQLKGFEVQVLGKWHRVASVESSPLYGIVELDLAGGTATSVSVTAGDLIPARLPKDAR